MKRSTDQAELDTSIPVLKRSATNNSTYNDSNDVSDEQQTMDYIQTQRNKALYLELRNTKRTLSEARRELELMRVKSEEMEKLVSLIQRAWSQLDIETSFLLDSLGDSVAISSDGSSEMLAKIMDIHQRYTVRSPINSSNELVDLDVDEWSSAEDIEKARSNAVEIVESEQKMMEGKDEVVNVTNILQNEDATAVEEHLKGHIAFTLSILERLCNAVCEGARAPEKDQESSLPEEMISSIRHAHGKLMFLSDENLKLRIELINLSAKAQLAENTKIKTAKSLERALTTIKELEERASSNANDAEKDDGNNIDSDKQKSNKKDRTEELALLRKIELLEKQLSESESMKAKAEMLLTEKLARPVQQTEHQLADMRKSMEELRQQAKQRITSLAEESESLQERVHDLELALSKQEQSSQQRIEQVLTATAEQVRTLQEERDRLTAKMQTMEAEVRLAEQLRKELDEHEALEESRKKRIQALEQQLQSLQGNATQYQKNLESLRKREKYLEELVSSGESSTATVSQVDADGYKQVIQQAQERTAELEQELQSANNTINDLITELDCMSASESQIREQSERLLRDISESKSLQRAALEENLKLQSQVEETLAKSKEIETKMEIMRTVMTQQHQLLTQAKEEEQALKLELSQITQDAEASKRQHQESLQQNQELQQKLKESLATLEAASKRNQELQQRCDELSKQCANERKQRLETERELLKRKSKKEKNSSAENGAQQQMSKDDQDMLELTLSMLKCSVCKDRFKSVAITRCFHLFCRDCIDENIRNRSRKCPACGEKFGQDDVANIYFTH